MKTSTKILSASIILGSFYYFYRAKPSVPLHDSEPKVVESATGESSNADRDQDSQVAASPKLKLHPMNNHKLQAPVQDSEPTPEGDPSPEALAGNEHNGDPSQTKPEVQSDSEIEGHLNEKIAADTRVQRVADILAVNCQSGTCVVRAQAKPDLEQELQMAFILFQKEHPEFGSNFRMEPNPDDPSINNFVYSKDNGQQAPTQMEPVSSNPPNVPQVTR
ncbi:MAG: hypothetical protein H7318_01090 [Oligoflexus sp.]|nr:hypothetical protein [Oligoflexus sp.]